MAQIPTDLFEWHPVVDEERRRGMPDPVRPERSQASAAGVIAPREHERDGIHRERLDAVALAGRDEEPARVVLPVRTGLVCEEWPSALEVREEGSPGLGLEGDVEGLAALASPEADERPLEVDLLEPKAPHTRVAA